MQRSPQQEHRLFKVVKQTRRQTRERRTVELHIAKGRAQFSVVDRHRQRRQRFVLKQIRELELSTVDGARCLIHMHDGRVVDLTFESTTHCRAFCRQLRRQLPLLQTRHNTALRRSPPWQRDDASEHCSKCLDRWSPVLNRRHHCRCCGLLFCRNCCGTFALLPELGFGETPVRVCDICAAKIADERVRGRDVSFFDSDGDCVRAEQASPEATAAAEEEVEEEEEEDHTLLSASELAHLSKRQLASPSSNEIWRRSPHSNASSVSVQSGATADNDAEDRKNNNTENNNTDTEDEDESSYDQHGFQVGHSLATHVSARYAAQCHAQRVKWNRFLVRLDLRSAEAQRSMFDLDLARVDVAAVRRLCRDGVPQDLRGSIWMLVSGARARESRAAPNYFAELCAFSAAHETKATFEIDKDLHRTFPQHRLFRKGGRGHERLRKVLTAYAVHNTAVGYCQSINFVAATLLSLVTSDRDAFWLLDTLVDRYATVQVQVDAELRPNVPAVSLVGGRRQRKRKGIYCYYEPDLRGVHVDARVLDSLVLRHLPQVAARLADIGVPLATVSLQWLMCFFVGALPSEYAMRVLDCVMVDGSRAVFRAALSLLKLNRKAILQCTRFDMLVELLKQPNGLVSPCTRGDTHDPSVLVRCMYEEWLNELDDFDTLQQLRQLYANEIEREMQQQKAARQQRGTPQTKLLKSRRTLLQATPPPRQHGESDGAAQLAATGAASDLSTPELLRRFQMPEEAESPAKTASGHVTTDRQSDHVASQSDHVTSQSDHVTSQSDHVTSQTDHVTTGPKIGVDVGLFIRALSRSARHDVVSTPPSSRARSAPAKGTRQNRTRSITADGTHLEHFFSDDEDFELDLRLL